MKKKLLLKKGYTLKITSWENDGDNSRAIEFHTEDKEYADAIIKMCKELLISKNSRKGKVGVGNSNDGEQIQDQVVKYMRENPVLLKGEDARDVKSDDQIFDKWNDLQYQLLGSSEYYQCRVFESIESFYSDEDIYVQEYKS